MRANSALNLSYKHTIKKLTKILSRSASGPKHKQTLILIDISKKKNDLTINTDFN